MPKSCCSWVRSCRRGQHKQLRLHRVAKGRHSISRPHACLGAPGRPPALMAKSPRPQPCISISSRTGTTPWVQRQAMIRRSKLSKTLGVLASCVAVLLSHPIERGAWMPTTSATEVREGADADGAAHRRRSELACGAWELRSPRPCGASASCFGGAW